MQAWYVEDMIFQSTLTRLSSGISEQYVCDLIRMILLINHFCQSVELVIAITALRKCELRVVQSSRW